MDFKSITDLAKRVVDKDGDGLEISDFTQFLGGLDLNQLLSNEFLSKFTQFESVKDLLAKVGVSHPEELLNVDKNKANTVISNHSNFGSLAELLMKAKEFLPK